MNHLAKPYAFDPSRIDPNWDEAELSDFWMSEILKRSGWNTNVFPQQGMRFRKERKSSGRDRVDFELWNDRHVVGCIEVKNPNTDFTDLRELRVWIQQASKYAIGRYRFHHGKLITPIGILTNGKHAIIFDGSRRHDEVLSFHKPLDLSKKDNLEEFLGIFNTDNWEANGVSKYEYARNKIEVSQKYEIEDGDTFLARDLLRLYRKVHKITNSKDKTRTAFVATIAVFMISVLRDCGLYPNDEIISLAKQRTKSSWEKLISGVEKIINSDLSCIKDEYCDSVWEIHDDSSWFSGNLATFPPTGLGKAYETLLQSVSENSTSFYTKAELVEEMLEALKPDISHSVLDPTCGSASFLASICEYIIEHFNPSAKEIQEYIENKICGVDKDWYAVQISKCVLASIYARNIPFSEENLNKFKCPSINIVNDDFFSYNSKTKHDIIIGNPPWGDVWTNLSEEYHSDIKKYVGYERKADLCIYVVEKALNKHLNDHGMFAFVLKHQVFDGPSHKRHRDKIWNGNVREIWDYGRRRLFHNGALSCVVIGSNEKTPEPPKVVYKGEPRPEGRSAVLGDAIDDSFDCYEGFRSGCDPVYRIIADKFPDSERSVVEIKDNILSSFQVLNGNARKTYMIPRGEKLEGDILKFANSERIALTYRKSKIRGESSSEKELTLIEHLHERSDCLRGKKHEGWLFIFRNGNNNGSIVISTFLRGERPRAARLSENSAVTASLIILTPRSNCSEERVFYTLAFLNTKLAMDIMKSTFPLAGGGTVNVQPETIKNLHVPICNNSELRTEIAKLASIASQKSDLPESTIESILDVIDAAFECIISGNIPDTLIKSIGATLKSLKSA